MKYGTSWKDKWTDEVYDIEFSVCQWSECDPPEIEITGIFNSDGDKIESVELPQYAHWEILQECHEAIPDGPEWEPEDELEGS